MSGIKKELYLIAESYWQKEGRARNILAVKKDLSFS